MNDEQRLALLDTGSLVTSISGLLYKTKFGKYPLQPVTKLLRVVCAEGQKVPFIGYINVDLEFPTNETGAYNIVHDFLLVFPNN